MAETAKDLGLSLITIKEIEALKLDEVKTLDALEIKKMRVKEKLSQAVMARVLNVTASTYQK